MDLVMYTLRSVAYVIVEPSLMVMLVALGIVFYMKNRKLTAMQKMILGEKVNSPLELTLSQIVLGIFAGIFISLVLSYFGVIFTENSHIEMLFIVSILLMLLKPRFICFSYSGAILGLLSVVCKYLDIRTSDGLLLFDVNIAVLMTFVGVIHIFEAFLVMVDGARGAIPVFSNKKGTIIGGYALKRSWVVPVAIFIAYAGMTSDGIISTQSVGTPDWWPILGYESITAIVASMILTMFPYFGVLGYSAVTFTRKKKIKALSSGIYILVYGILLCIVAQVAAVGGLAGQLIVLAFAPAAHEGMLYLQRKAEDNREPMFVSNEDGLAILEVIPFSQAYNLGLKPGDKISLVNGKIINKENEIYDIAKENYNKIVLTILDSHGDKKEYSYNHQPNSRLGIVLVPKVVDMERVISFEDKKFSDILDEAKNKKDLK
ncbi:MAG: signal protein PDZ [Clostridiaceae bacterium]|nr:signal protein PDZ [Clostridiaceae bacterium]